MASDVTNSALGSRVSHLDGRVGGLETSVSTLGVQVSALAADSKEIKASLQSIGNAVGSQGARTGTIPTTTVTWAITAFVAMAALGMSMLGLFNSGIQKDITSNAEFDDLKMTEIKHDVEENRTLVLDLIARLRLVELENSSKHHTHTP